MRHVLHWIREVFYGVPWRYFYVRKHIKCTRMRALRLALSFTHLVLVAGPMPAGFRWSEL